MFNTTINTSLLTTYLIKKFIPALENQLQLQRATLDAMIPPGQGKIARWNVFSSPPETTTPLAEGTTTGNEIVTYTTTGTEATIKEYGEFVKVSSLEEYAAVEGTRSELVKRFTYGGSKTLDTVCRTEALLTTTAAYARSDAVGAQTTAEIPTACSAAAIVECSRILMDNSAMGLTGVSGHDDGAYFGVFTPRALRQTINEGTTGRLTWGQAVTNVPGVKGQDKFIKGKVGTVGNVACYMTQNYTQTTVTSLSDNNFVIGEAGLGAVAFRDMNARIVVNDVNSPYKNLNTIAYFAEFAAKLLDSARIVRLYTNATAGT